MKRFVIVGKTVETAETMFEALKLGDNIIKPGEPIPPEIYAQINPVTRAIDKHNIKWFEWAFFQFREKRNNLTLAQAILAYCRLTNDHAAGRLIFEEMGKVYPSEFAVNDSVEIIGPEGSDEIGRYGEVIEVLPETITLLGCRRYHPKHLRLVPKFKVGEVVKYGDRIGEILGLFRDGAQLDCCNKHVWYGNLERV